MICYTLTPTEIKILKYLMEHPGQVMTLNQIADQIWELNKDVDSSNVVKSHIAHIRQKITPREQYNELSQHYIETVVGIGYKFVEHSQEQ